MTAVSEEFPYDKSCQHDLHDRTNRSGIPCVSWKPYMATDIHKCCASCVKRKNSSFSCSDDDLRSSDRTGQPQCIRIKKDNHEDIDLDSGLSGSDVDSNQRRIQLRHHASGLGGWTSFCIQTSPVLSTWILLTFNLPGAAPRYSLGNGLADAEWPFNVLPGIGTFLA